MDGCLPLKMVDFWIRRGSVAAAAALAAEKIIIIHAISDSWNNSVWLDVRLKSCPMCPKSCPMFPKSCPMSLKSCPMCIKSCQMCIKSCQMSLKSCPMFLKSCPMFPKSGYSSFYLKSNRFQSSQRSNHILGILLLQKMSLEFFKIAQSGQGANSIKHFTLFIDLGPIPWNLTDPLIAKN